MQSETTNLFLKVGFYEVEKICRILIGLFKESYLDFILKSDIGELLESHAEPLTE